MCVHSVIAHRNLTKVSAQVGRGAPDSQEGGTGRSSPRPTEKAGSALSSPASRQATRAGSKLADCGRTAGPNAATRTRIPLEMPSEVLKVFRRVFPRRPFMPPPGGPCRPWGCPLGLSSSLSLARDRIQHRAPTLPQISPGFTNPGCGAGGSGVGDGRSPSPPAHRLELLLPACPGRRGAGRVRGGRRLAGAAAQSRRCEVCRRRQIAPGI